LGSLIDDHYLTFPIYIAVIMISWALEDNSALFEI